MRVQYEKILIKIKKNNPEKIFFYGISELTEIAILSAKINNIKIDGIYDPSSKKLEFCDLRVIHKLNSQMSKKGVFFVHTEKKVLSSRNKKLNIIIPNFLQMK